MKNLKKTLALLAALAMAGSMFTACNKPADDKSSTEETTKAGEETTKAEEKAALPADTGKTLKIYT